mmetsp:Transcript_17856/g.32284  ORF Transcript_17856/g.32284 Transcript_17856/m.32284 type:complete len:303 (+) Transcript_17856:439-1347(+)
MFHSRRQPNHGLYPLHHSTRHRKLRIRRTRLRNHIPHHGRRHGKARRRHTRRRRKCGRHHAPRRKKIGRRQPRRERRRRPLKRRRRRGGRHGRQCGVLVEWFLREAILREGEVIVAMGGHEGKRRSYGSVDGGIAGFATAPRQIRSRDLDGEYIWFLGRASPSRPSSVARVEHSMCLGIPRKSFDGSVIRVGTIFLHGVILSFSFFEGCSGVNGGTGTFCGGGTIGVIVLLLLGHGHGGRGHWHWSTILVVGDWWEGGGLCGVLLYGSSFLAAHGGGWWHCVATENTLLALVAVALLCCFSL